MWSNVISLDKQYNKEFDFLFQKLKNNKNLSYAYEESRNRNFLYLASLCESSIDVINDVENAICEVYLNHFKLSYFLAGNKNKITHPLVALSSALLLFDHAYEDTLIRKVLSEVIDYNIDGVLYFRLKSLTENWEELSNLIANLLTNSSGEDDIYSVVEFIHSQEGGKYKLLLDSGKLINLTKSKNVSVENLFDNDELNLLFAIIKESPTELFIKNTSLSDKLKKSIRPFAILKDATKYD